MTKTTKGETASDDMEDYENATDILFYGYSLKESDVPAVTEYPQDFLWPQMDIKP